MDTNIKGRFYNEVTLEICKPVIADISENDYVAEVFKYNWTIKEERHPFIVCHNEAVTLKVVPFYDATETPVVWNFPAGPYPMPLRKILNDAGNSATQIQIGY